MAMAPNAEPPRQLGVGHDHQTSRLTGVRRAKNSPIDSPHVWSRAASAPSGHPTAASMPAALMTVRFVGPEVLAPRASWPQKRVPARARTEESQGRQPRVLLVAHPAARRSPAIERFCIGIGRSPLLTGYFIGRPKARARHRSMRRSLSSSVGRAAHLRLGDVGRTRPRRVGPCPRDQWPGEVNDPDAVKAVEHELDRQRRQ